MDVEVLFGTEKARLVAENFTKATTLVESIIQEEGINCEFERLDGYLFALPCNGFKNIDKEVSAAQRAEVEKLERVPG